MTAVWSCFVLFISANTSAPVISPLFIWILGSTFVTDCGAVICLILRIFRMIDRQNSFVYTLIATSNFVFGLTGVFFYCINKIDASGLHYLLYNLFLGTLLLADIFFFDVVFDSK